MTTAAGPLRIALVGAGHMGTKHLQKVREIGPRIGAKVTVVVEPDEKRQELLAKEYADMDIKFVSNVGELTNVDASHFPEAAIVAVPASIHNETSIACLAKGRHILVEKPLGFSRADCLDMDNASSRAKRILQVGLLERWSMCHLWDNWKPEPGPWTIQAHRVGPFVPRAADTDVIHDLMIHDLDLFVLLQDVFSLPKVDAVRAWGRKLRSPHLDHVKVALDLQGGGTAHFFASRLAADPSRGWEITGPSWHASVDMMRRSFKRFEKRHHGDKVYFEPHETHWTQGDPLGLEIEAFVQRVRGTFETSTGITAKDPIFSFWEPSKIIPTARSVMKTHEIIDEVLSQIKILG